MKGLKGKFILNLIFIIILIVIAIFAVFFPGEG